MVNQGREPSALLGHLPPGVSRPSCGRVFIPCAGCGRSLDRVKGSPSLLHPPLWFPDLCRLPGSCGCQLGAPPPLLGAFPPTWDQGAAEGHLATTWSLSASTGEGRGPGDGQRGPALTEELREVYLETSLESVNPQVRWEANEMLSSDCGWRVAGAHTGSSWRRFHSVTRAPTLLFIALWFREQLPAPR